MNGEIASAVAWTPEDRRFMVENQTLNWLDAELASLRRQHMVIGVRPDGGLVPMAVVEAKSRIRLREMHKRLIRATVQLHAAGVR